MSIFQNRISVFWPVFLLVTVSLFMGTTAWAVESPEAPTTRTIRTEAHVTVSDGLEYDTATVFHDPQRAVFRITYPDREVTLGVDGKYYWEFDGEKESEGSVMLESIVLGHQIHAQLLFFEGLNGPLEPPHVSVFENVECEVVQGRNGRSLLVGRESRRPVALVFPRDDEPDIMMTFEDWRKVEGFDLPFVVVIDDGERVFRYEYDAIVFDEGSTADYRAPMELLTGEQQLMRLHRRVMDAHFFSDADMMKGWFAEESVTAYQGEIHSSGRDESETGMARSLGRRKHTRYDDLIRPIIRVSEDGTLGWVLVQVQAEGVRLDDQGRITGPLDFTCAWIAMFEKSANGWQQVGNVSNFKPDRD